MCTVIQVTMYLVGFSIASIETDASLVVAFHLFQEDSVFFCLFFINCFAPFLSDCVVV